ncbi:MAG: RDD family protein [Chloroflexi bacterium]|nr:RDD family protein [Chloroflexota bacterium]
MKDRLAEIQQALDAFRRDEARALAKEELAENPSAAAYYLAAQAARREGDRVDYLRKALELDPDYQPAADELAQIFPAEKDKREPVGVAAEAPIEKPKTEQAVTPMEPVVKAKTDLRLASISRRWLAIVIDGFIVALATVLMMLAGGAMAPLEAAMVSADEAAIADAFSQFQSTTLMVNLLVSGVYNVVLMVSFNGQTLGKMMLRLRVVKKRGGRITILDALLRNVFGYTVSQIFLLGYLWALFDREKQAWHDKMAGTVVVEEAQRTSV